MDTREALIAAVAEVLVGVKAQPFDLVLEPSEARAVAERVIDRLGIELDRNSLTDEIGTMPALFRIRAALPDNTEGAVPLG